MSMELRLSANGVDKLLGQLTGVVVQLISLEEKLQNNQSFFTCEVSDGYCKIRGCVLADAELNNQQKLIDNAVVRVTKSGVQKNKKQKMIVIVEEYEHLAQPPNLIGKPILYDDFIKNGKNNPEGDSLVPPQKPLKNDKEKRKPETKPRGFSDDDTASIDENTRNSKNQPVKNQNPSTKTNFNPQNSNTNTTKPPNPPQQRSNSTNPPLKQDSRAVSREQKPKQGPIQRLPVRKSEGDSVGRQRKPNSEYTEIRSLFVGMENWVIMGRIISLNPIKAFVNKKGSESFVLSFQIGDRSGVIEGNIFGEMAQRFESTLKEDQLYQISNGMVGENSFMGSHKLKITVVENSKVNLKEDDPNIPYMEDFCVTVKKLIELPVGDEARVICLVKDQGEVQSLTSKEGKPLRKKAVLLCDPVQKVEVEVVLWNDNADTRFEKYPYALKGVLIKEYQGNRQYAFKSNYRATLLKQHPLRKYIKDLQGISFVNPDSNRKANRKTAITNLNDLNNALDEVSSTGTWSEVVCFLTTIRHSGKNYYIGCPKCKRKVQKVEGTTCQHCNTAYDEAQHRYVLSLSIADYRDAIWVTAYDEAGEALMGMPARQFANLKEEDLQEHLRRIRYRQKKLRMVTKNEDFNGTVRKKTTVIKVTDINYAEQTKSLLDKVKYLLSK